MKKCNGFDSFCCFCCERYDIDEPGTLVKSLAVDPDNGKKTCNHWVKLNTITTCDLNEIDKAKEL